MGNEKRNFNPEAKWLIKAVADMDARRNTNP